MNTVPIEIGPEPDAFVDIPTDGVHFVRAIRPTYLNWWKQRAEAAELARDEAAADRDRYIDQLHDIDAERAALATELADLQKRYDILVESRRRFETLCDAIAAEQESPG